MDSGHWTVDSGQWTVDSVQWTVYSVQWTVDSGQWTVEQDQENLTKKEHESNNTNISYISSTRLTRSCPRDLSDGADNPNVLLQFDKVALTH